MLDSNKRQRPLASEYRSRRILTLQQWAELNSLSYFTAKRLIAKGDGPKVTQLSQRRIGIREDHNDEWQAARVRSARD
jgi:predicted DNA-binding transcriptional regulator AlpA